MSNRLVRLSLLFLCVLLLSPFSLPANAKTYVITNGSHMLTFESGQAAAAPEGSAPPIQRGKEVFLSFRGTDSCIMADCETVGQLLNQLELELADTDVPSLPLDTPITDGMSVRVDSVITRQEVYTSTLPHDNLHCQDDTLPVGMTETLIEGRDGELLCTADVTYCNGTEVSREILREDLTISPITEVIAQGSADPLPPEEASQMPVIGDGYIIMPSGELLTYYKTDYVTATGYTHTDAGCDMITSTGTTVRYGTAAVDPRFIPYGTRMLIVSHDGERYYGIATAEDCGGAIKRDKMDLYFPTYQECIEFGRRRCTIYFLG